MEFVLELQELQAADTDFAHHSGHGGGASNLSLVASCADSTISLLTCH